MTEPQIAIVKASELGDDWTAKAHVAVVLTPQQRLKNLKREYRECERNHRRLSKREEKGKVVRSNEWERSDDWYSEIADAAMALLTDPNWKVKFVRKQRGPAVVSEADGSIGA